MKTKGAVKFFAIALAVVCLFQLSFTFLANQWDDKANQFAKGDSALKQKYLDSTGRKTIFNIGIKKYNYLDVKERALNLGLDLRGGMHVTMEVAIDELFFKLSDNSDDENFKKALANAKKISRTSQKPYLDIFYEELKKLNPNARLSAIFATRDNKDAGIDVNASDEKVLQFLKDQSKSALDRTFNIIRTRIDKFGVTQPNITMDEGAGRITVELPGADDPDRIRKYLQGSAKLEFYQTYTLNEIFPYLDEADKLIEEQIKATGKDKDSSQVAKTTTAPDSTKVSADIPLANTKDSVQTDSSKAIAEAKKKEEEAKKRLYPLISKLFAFQPTNEMGKQAIAGYVLLKDTGAVMKLLNRQDVRANLPPEVKFLWSNKALEGELIQLIPLKTTGIPGEEAILDGSYITDARKDVNPQSSTYEVTMQMNSEGAREWAKITRDNIGKAIAIVLDNQVYSAPNVNGEIPGGRSSITGNFSATEAGDLANVLKAGKLPVRLEIIEEAVVGPSLGKESISSGLYSLLAGLLAIVVFMVIYYNRSGFVANIALLINLFFILGVLTSLNAALTLPGIAGIVLTLATAVDANVLIYERIRDELFEGKSIKQAIDEGYKMALSSILDANIVQLLIGIILLTFGSGPIFGFAAVLVIGILTSMFCSILITRLIFNWLLEKDRPISFGSEKASSLFRNINFDFVGKRKIFYVVSGVTIIIGLISLSTRGLNYGVDFEGGYSYVVEFEKPTSTTIVRDALTKTFNNSTPEVKTFGSDSKLSITTDFGIEEGETTAKVKETLLEGLKPFGKVSVISEQSVGSTVASDIKNSAFNSILFSLLVIFLYIILRFRRWQFALGATVALAHDVLFVLTIFSLFKGMLPFSLDVDQTIIAALLTIVGYSMNDTVVVFDRIRENLNLNKRSPIIPIINDSINKTLSRTVITSLTIFMVLVVLFFFGGQVIKGFSFAMLIGIVVGTYSSIFVATPILVDFHGKRDELTA